MLGLKRIFSRQPDTTIRDLILSAPYLFDAHYYVTLYPDVTPSGLDPFEHFMQTGLIQGRRAHILFDPDYYRKTHAAHLSPGDIPLVHYLQGGAVQGLAPHIYFDGRFYLDRAGDAAPLPHDPLKQYLEGGWKSLKTPHPLFDPDYYVSVYPDIAEAGLEPLQHYLRHGSLEGRKPHPLFDPALYVRRIASPEVTLANAIEHYLANDPDWRGLQWKLTKLTLTGGVRRVDDWAKAHGIDVTELKPAQAVSWPTPYVIGKPKPETTITATLPRNYVAVLDDMKVIPGARVVITPGNEMLHDELSEPDAALYHPKLHALGRFENAECKTNLYLSSTHLEEAILASSDTDWNYFHWMVEALPKLSMIEQLGVPEHVPLIVSTGLHANQLDAMRRVLGKRPYRELPANVAVTVGKLYYCSDMSRVLDNVESKVRVDYDIAVSRDAVRWMRQHLDTPKGKPVRKIYVERASTYRLLVNEAELMDALKAQGFEIVNTAKLNLDQQIALFSEAALVISPTGAAMTNLMFCPPEARVLIMVAANTQSNLNIFNHITEALGANMSYCLGERAFTRTDIHTVHDDFTINVGDVVKWCEGDTGSAA